MTSSTPRVSLLLPNRNNDRVLDLVLDRLATNTTYAAAEVIAVDDGSTDASREILRRWQASGRFPAFELIEKPASGVVDTLNAALAAASGEVCVQLDADASVETPGWIERMLELLLIDDQVGVVVAKVVMDTGQIHACGIDVISPKGLRDRGATITEPVGRRQWHWRMTHPPESTAGHLTSRVAEVDSGIGVCMMYRRADALAAGGYDPNYSPVWFDDLDLCIAIRKSNKKVFFLPEVRVVHHLTGRNPRAPSTVRHRMADLAVRAGRRLLPDRAQSWIRGRHHFGPHTPEQLDRLRHHYAYWRAKWGWDLLNPDMDAIRQRWGETEIWWAHDPARHAAGERIIETFRSRSRVDVEPSAGRPTLSE